MDVHRTETTAAVTDVVGAEVAVVIASGSALGMRRASFVSRMHADHVRNERMDQQPPEKRARYHVPGVGARPWRRTARQLG